MLLFKMVDVAAAGKQMDNIGDYNLQKAPALSFKMGHGSCAVPSVLLGIVQAVVCCFD